MHIFEMKKKTKWIYNKVQIWIIGYGRRSRPNLQPPMHTANATLQFIELKISISKLVIIHQSTRALNHALTFTSFHHFSWDSSLTTHWHPAKRIRLVRCLTIHYSSIDQTNDTKSGDSSRIWSCMPGKLNNLFISIQTIETVVHMSICAGVETISNNSIRFRSELNLLIPIECAFIVFVLSLSLTDGFIWDLICWRSY